MLGYPSPAPLTQQVIESASQPRKIKNKMNLTSHENEET